MWCRMTLFSITFLIHHAVNIYIYTFPYTTLFRSSQVSTADNLWGKWEALWPTPGLLVWKQANFTASFWGGGPIPLPLVTVWRSEEHTSELQSHSDLVCRLLLEKKKVNN